VYRTERIETNFLNEKNYVSTENMLSDKGGIVDSSYPPSGNNSPAFKSNDILVSNIRPYFKKIWFAQYEGGCSNDVIVFKPNEEKVDPKFLYFQLSKDEFFDYMMSGANGTKMPRGNKKAIPKFKFSIPKSLNTQKRIASILSSYDDLIENNLKRIKLLEETAQNIYKEWFVNFRFPNYENTPFNEETGLPVGWKKGKVSDLCEVKSGYAFKSKDWQTQGNPVMKIKNITNNTVDIIDCDYVDDEVAKNAGKFELFEGDVLIAMTGATVGKVGLIPKIDKRIYINQRVGLFRPFSESQNNVYLIFAFFMSDDALKQILNFAGGAAQPNISSTQIAEVELNIGSEEIQKIFQHKINPIMNQIQIMYNQNQKLKEARDILLPRLMNRTIEV
jgi:type I restriction enzyme S subunit